MADLPKLPKRPDYFQAQFLVVRDFQDEQTYHAEMLWRHNRGLHEWGVVRDGLQVSMTSDKKNLSISPGSAIDSLGREIVLEADQLLSIDKVTSQFDKALSSPQDVFITISFHEVDSNASEDKYPGTDNVTRQMQSPIIAAAKSPVTDGSVITVARVSVTSSNEVSQPDNSARKVASSFIARGSNLGDISLDGALSFTSKSSPNPTYPQVGLDYDSGSDALRIRARTQNAPELDTTYVTIKRDTGNVGIGTVAPGARLQIFDAPVDSALYSLSNWNGTGSAVSAFFKTATNNGGRTLADTQPALVLGREGVPLAAFPNFAEFKIGRYENAGGSARTRLDIALTHGDGDAAGANVMTMLSSGNVGIGIATPQAKLQVNGGADTSLIIGDRGTTAGSVGLQFLGTHYRHAGLRFDGDSVIVENASNSYLPSSWYWDAQPMNFIVRNGNVGIGSVQPLARLEIQGGAASDGTNDPKAMALAYRTGGFRHWIRTRHNATPGPGNAIDFYVNNDPTTYGSSGPNAGSLHVMTLDSGRVGIGTTNPQVPLEVAAQQSYPLTKSPDGFGPDTGFKSFGESGSNFDVSILTSGWVAGAGIVANSDRRIKEIVGQSDTRKDLEIIQKLRVTNYRPLDKMAEGNSLRRGFIGQEVVEVLPQAVASRRNVIPDIYSKATGFAFDQNQKTLSITLPKAHALTEGQVVKILTEDASKTVTVVAVPTPGSFVVGEFEKEPKHVFVYGRQVDDFLAVHYDQIFTTAVGAIQEVKKEKDEEVKVLRAELAGLKAANGALTKRLQLLEGRLDTDPSVVVAKTFNGNGRH
jgi:hypothetical protein